MCQMIFTSDQAFFDRIGEKETKRYFEECYNFICNYKNLGEKNIIAAVVHLDEDAPHMHLMFVPVVHTKDKDGNDIDKICARDFWKGRDSYRKLQDAYFNRVKYSSFIFKKSAIFVKSVKPHNIPHIVIINISINLYFFPLISLGSSNTSNLSNNVFICYTS